MKRRVDFLNSRKIDIRRAYDGIRHGKCRSSGNKTSSSILAFKEDIVSKSVETACINCARCVDVCPSRIIPSRLADLAQRHDEKAFVAMNGLECVECGSCSYVCPAKRPLKQAIGSMRKIALANKRKK